MSNVVKKGYARHLDIKHGCVDMSHGGGGRAMVQIITDIFAKHLGNEYLAQGNDGTCLPSANGRLVVSTDSHVVSPLFFPGGDIGGLSVHGTVNDVAVMGAMPLYLTAGFILEEGFPLKDLEAIVISMAQAAKLANVKLVAGDTKVVEQGKGDGVFITTTGIGFLPEGINLSGTLVRPGDVILVSGSMGDHGTAIMSKRENLTFDTPILSDTASLNGLTAAMLATGANIRVMRDPTRGGLAATINEIAQQSNVGIHLQEASIPVKPEVHAACELLGLDPINIANEGKLIAFCAAEHADNLLVVMRSHPLGLDAAIIGYAVEDANCFVQMQTKFGGKRMVDWLSGEQLPRIC
ncbi:MAG: hydrogenase expression/formation protein HypE [Betaproteobacteria bacterium]|nr:hydrogenase expression/formation protein HypE [Betaproteobacteria bacterium]